MKYLDEARAQIFLSAQTHNCCLYAFLSALVASTTNQFDGRMIELTFVDNTQYLFIKNTITKLYADRVNCTDGDFAGKKFILLDGVGIGEMLDDLALSFVDNSFVSSPRIVENDCCRLAFAQGLFVGAGKFYTSQDINAKSTGYNMEISFFNAKMLKLGSQVFCALNVKLKQGKRLGKSILYLRDSEQIGDLFVTLGAIKASLEFQNDLSLRTMKNNINRQNNCYDANQTKTINASFEQIKAIEKLRDSGMLERLDEDMRLLAVIRLDNPDSSLSELCELFPRKVTRAGMKYKLDKFITLSQKKKD